MSLPLSRTQSLSKALLNSSANYNRSSASQSQRGKPKDSKGSSVLKQTVPPTPSASSAGKHDHNSTLNSPLAEKFNQPTFAKPQQTIQSQTFVAAPLRSTIRSSGYPQELPPLRNTIRSSGHAQELRPGQHEAHPTRPRTHEKITTETYNSTTSMQKLITTELHVRCRRCNKCHKSETRLDLEVYCIKCARSKYYSKVNRAERNNCPCGDNPPRMIQDTVNHPSSPYYVGRGSRPYFSADQY